MMLRLWKFFQKFLTPKSSYSYDLQKDFSNDKVSANALGIEYFLDKDYDAASQLANEGLMASHAFLSDKHAVEMGDLIAVLHRAFENSTTGSILLSLPCNLTSLGLLRQAQQIPTWKIVVVASPLTLESLSKFELLLPSMAVNQAKDIIRHLKASRQDTKQAMPTLYVSFPELNIRNEGAVITLPFLGKTCKFSVLDPLLYVGGNVTLFTLKTISLAGKPTVTLESFTPSSSDMTKNAMILEVMDWLFSRIQNMASSLPSQTFSWGYLYRDSDYYIGIERANGLRQIETFFTCWHDADVGLEPETYTKIMARLKQLGDGKQA